MAIPTLGQDPGMVGTVSPSFQQQQPVTSPTMGVANMINALAQGDQQYKWRQAMLQAAQRTGTPGVPTGQPLNLVPQLKIPPAPGTTPPPFGQLPSITSSWNPGSSGGALY